MLLKVKVDPTQGVGKPVDRSSITKQTWAPSSPYHFPGEPAFVPRTDDPNAAEDDGLAHEYGECDVLGFRFPIICSVWKKPCRMLQLTFCAIL